MRCPKCGKDVELQKKQVGVDENGKPIFNEYAICKECKKQWNLNKQRDKKPTDANAFNNIQPKKSVPAKAKPAAPKDSTVKEKGARSAAPSASSPTEKKQPVKKGAQEMPPVKKAPPKKKPASAEAKPVAQKAPAAPTAKATSPVKKAVSGSGKTVASTGNAAVAVNKAAQARRPSPNDRPSANSSTAPDGKPIKPVRRSSDTTRSVGPESKAASEQRPAPKKMPIAADTARRRPDSTDQDQRYSNIPPEKVRAKRERVVKNNYEDMLAADPDRKPVNKPRPKTAEESAPKKNPTPFGSAPAARQPASAPEDIASAEIEELNPKFRTLRIIFGIISILAFAFFAYKGFMAGLNNISSGKNATTGTTYIILALCMLIAGLLLLIMQKKRTIFSFVLPMLFYVACAAFSFYKRADDKFLLYGAIAGAILAVIFLVLTIASRGGDDDYNYDDDYDDPYEEEQDNY